MPIALMRKLVAGAMSIVVIGSLTAWFLTRETLPEVIRIATAEEGGFYYQVGLAIEPLLEQRTGVDVELLVSRGSVENRELLLSGAADLAILQGGAVDAGGLVALAPVYREPVHVIARQGSGVTELGDLAGRRVVLGPLGSGMRESAKAILQHYRIELTPAEPTRGYFKDLLAESDLDAAIVTTGLLNPDLGRVLASGRFELLPILDAEALSIRHHHFHPETIPRGFYLEGPPVPPSDVPTVATTSFVAALGETSSLIVRATLEAFYEDDLRRRIPTMIPRQAASAWDELPIHPAAQSYYQPYGGLEILANFMESLAALKELVFALGAGLYLLWASGQRGKQRQQERELQVAKDRLDVFLNRTMDIERTQMEIEDPAQLKAHLRQVTATKLQALEELTHEELRGDVSFAIFLQQCGDLARKIQAKLEICGAEATESGRDPGPPREGQRTSP
ncbi:MAG: TAXI family TRAP transporter solute-binding subunit [Acidobacteriota bacterium]